MKGVKNMYSFDDVLGDVIGDDGEKDSDESDSDLEEEMDLGTQHDEISIELDEKSVQISSHLT
jgi:hypothetical protein